MNRLLCGVALIGACVIGLGFYMGWFHIGSENKGSESKVTLTVDKDKIKEDSKTAVTKAENLEHQIKEKVTGSTAKTMDGEVVSVTADKLTMSEKGGKEHSHTLAANVKVTCDGKVCTVADLKKGMRIRVTTDAKDSNAADRIEALDNNREFEKGP